MDSNKNHDLVRHNCCNCDYYYRGQNLLGFCRKIGDVPEKPATDYKCEYWKNHDLKEGNQ